MTAATNPSNYVDFDEYVGLKLEKTRSTIRTTDLLTALAGVSAMFLGYLLIFVVLDQWVVTGGFGVAWRWALLSTLVISTIAWLVWKVGLPSMRSVNGLFAAREIEKAEPSLKSNLLNLIDLKAAGRTINPVILKAMERQAAVRLQHIDVSHAVNHRPLVHTAYVLLAVIVAFCFYALLSPKKISNSIWRGLLPASQVPIATITEILDVKPGDITVPAHQPFVEIQVDLAGEIPSQVTLLYTSADGKHDQPVELRPEQDGLTRFKGQLIGDGGQGLMQDLTYFIRAGDASSRQYRITVEQPPYAEIETLNIEFPGYMKLQPIEQVNNGAIDAWEGAKVVITAKTNMPVRSGMIQFLDDPQAGPTGEEVAMSVTRDGRQLQAQWTLAVRMDGTFPKYYRIHCRTEDGRATTGHVMNPLTIRPDLPPEVALIQPDRDIEAPANAVIPLLIQARDPDFELGYLYLNAEKSGQRIIHEKISDGHQSKLTLKHDFELFKLNPAVGETIEMWIEAYDNKQPRPNSKNTPKIKIRVVQPVSKKEAEQQLADGNERREQKIAEVDPESNSEQMDTASPRDGNSKDQQPLDTARPSDANPNPAENPNEKPSEDGQKGATQSKGSSSAEKNRQNSDRKDGSGQPNADKKSGTENNPNDPSKGQSSAGSNPKKPLNDGSQDDEIIRRINETISKNSKTRDDSTSDPLKREEPQPANDQSENQERPKPSEDKSNSNESPKKAEGNSRPDAVDGSKPKPDQSPKDGTKTPNETKDDPAENDPTTKSPLEDPKKEGRQPSAGDSSNEPSPKKEKNSDTKSPEKDGTGEKHDVPDAREIPKENPKPASKSDKNSTDGKKPNPKSNDKPKEETTPSKSGDKENQPGESGGEKTESKPDQDMPNRAVDESNDKSNGDKSETSTAENTDGPKSGKTPEQKPSESSKDQQKPAESDNNDSQKANGQSNKNLPTGTNKQSPKPSASETGDAAKPKNGDSDPDSKTNGSNDEGSDPQNADGTKKSVEKSNRDSKTKPNQSKNQDAARNANEKSESRPREPKSENAEPSQNDTTKKPQSAKKTSRESQPPGGNENSQEKMNGDGTDSQPGKGDESGDAKSDTDKGRQATDAGKEVGSQKEPSNSKGSGSPKSDSAEGGEKSASESGADKEANDKGGDEAKSKDDKADGDKQPGSSPQKSTSDKGASDKQSAEKKSADSKPKGENKAEKGGKSGSDKKGGDKSKNAPSDKGSEKSGKSESGKKDAGDDDGAASGAEGSSSKPADKPGAQGDPEGDSKGVGGANSPVESTATHGGETAEVGKSEEANLEYNRRATELILQKLKKDLERGDVDPELLEQLGWTKSEMKQFADRLSKSLSESKLAEDTPEAKARQQQFQEMLKNLDLQKAGAQRSGEKEPKRDIHQVESKRTPPPEAYRKAYEKFTKDLARQKPSAGEKSAK